MPANNTTSYWKRTRKCLSDCLKVPVIFAMLTCSLKTCQAQYQLNNPWWNPSYPFNFQHQYPVQSGTQNQFTAQSGSQNNYPPQNYPVLTGQFSRPPTDNPSEVNAPINNQLFVGYPLPPKPVNPFGTKPVNPSKPWWVSSQNASHFVIQSPDGTSQNQIFGSGEKGQSHKFMNSHQSPSTTIGYASYETVHNTYSRILKFSNKKETNVRMTISSS